MKLAVIFAVALVMMMGQDVQSWRAWRDATRAVARVAVPIVRSDTFQHLSRSALAVLGKRSVDAAFDAAFDAATENGVLTADEINALLGLEGQELADLIAEVDMNGDGQIDLQEFIDQDAKDD